MKRIIKILKKIFNVLIIVLFSHPYRWEREFNKLKEKN
jgi:hypothetical protein